MNCPLCGRSVHSKHHKFCSRLVRMSRAELNREVNRLGMPDTQRLSDDDLRAEILIDWSDAETERNS